MAGLQGVTVTGSPQLFLPVVPPAVSSVLKPGESSINFKNNCMVCLKEEEPGKMMQILTTNPKNLKSFQPIVNYLAGTSNTPGKDRGLKGLPQVKNLPPLCVSCYDTAAEVYRMHQELLQLEAGIQNKVDILRRAVAATTKYHFQSVTTKALFLKRLKNSGMPPEQVEEMSTFVDNFHGRICAQVGRKVKFPQHPPAVPTTPTHVVASSPIILVPVSIQTAPQPTSVSGPATCSTAASPLISNIPPSKLLGVPSVGGPVPPSTTLANATAPSTQTTAVKDKPIATVTRTSAGVTISRGSTSRLPQPPKTVSTCPPAASNTSTSSIVSTFKAPVVPETMSRDSNIVIIPGSSRTLKFENEMDDEEEGHDEGEDGMEILGMDEDAMSFDQGEPPAELEIKEEADLIHFGSQKRKRKKKSEESDEEWQVSQEEDSDSETASAADEQEADMQSEKVYVAPLPLKVSGSSPVAAKRKPGTGNRYVTPTPPGISLGGVILKPQLQPLLPKVVPVDPIVLGSAIVFDSETGLLRRQMEVADPPSQKDETAPIMVQPRVSTAASIYTQLMLNCNGGKKTDPVECDICTEKHFPDQLKIHVRRVHYGGRTNGHYCTACDQVFISRSRLAKHLEMDLCCKDKESRPQMDLQSLLTCLECKCQLSGRSTRPKFSTVVNLRNHVFAEHEKVDLSAPIAPYPFTCTICDAKFYTALGFDFHMNTHVRFKRRFSTYQSDSSDYSYEPHLETCPPGTKYPLIGNPVCSSYLCDLCPQKMAAKGLSDHLTSKHGVVPNDLIKCAFCEYSTSISKSYADHLASIHVSEPYKPCHVCGETFSRIRNLRLHLWHNHGKGKAEKISCRFCDQQFTLLRLLHTHLRDIHGIAFKHQLRLLAAVKGTMGQLGCLFCPASNAVFKTPSDFQQHLFHVHDQQNPNGEIPEDPDSLKCTICKIKFSVPRSYRNHMTAFHDTHEETLPQGEQGNQTGAEPPIQISDDDDEMEVLATEPPFIKSALDPLLPKRGFVSPVKLGEHYDKVPSKIGKIVNQPSLISPRRRVFLCGKCHKTFVCEESLHLHECVARRRDPAGEKLLNPTTPPSSSSRSTPGKTECVVNVTGMPMGEQPAAGKESYKPAILRRKQK